VTGETEGCECFVEGNHERVQGLLAHHIWRTRVKIQPRALSPP
jgi:hypothetical protein